MPTDTPQSGPLLEVSGLGKQVSSGNAPLQILQDIAFAVGAGEALAIVGASGSGKSTLLGLLAGLDLPSSGSVRIAGQDIFALDEDARAELRGDKVGFVFQSFQLLPALTALENVMLPLELANAERVRERSVALLERVGLGSRLTHYPRQLSGGEQQRVALARAFAPAPQLLLADEPTGNLDAATGASIIDLMFEMNAEQGTTLVLVTHDEALAARCSRRIRLAAGRMAA
ncbi:MAG: ATP-binding cassette domain-containing protein [Methyloversatilis discipulorum]|uniref:ABC transporter ATP-binding protein n=1 Tax=Methyloversatilis discipulorum TaxID=1119528 RepID=UPI0026EDB0F8|nr:ATP-binding cassette domain-containing protein [Methyloversatilis discipulorum]MBT9517009.1 ATP-binding cassette domain-containing protein [Methyloversatilis discipulorum]